MNMNPMDNEHDVDRWLDAALGQFGKAEPRPGLEGRVLANLRAEKERTARRRWWWVLGTAGATAAIVAIAWFGHEGRVRDLGRSPAIVNRRSVESPSRSAASPLVAKQAPQRGVLRPGVRTTHAVQAKAPRLEQFPTPAPLSDQEKLLARYAKEFHEKAVVMARLQTELRNATEREMAAPWPQKADSTGLGPQE